MSDKNPSPKPIRLCRFEELADRENRLREEAARKAKPKPR